MESNPVVKRSLSDEVKKHLKSYIFSLNATENQKLPSEAVIAEEYGVSRVTIRRVMDDLEQEGLVIRIHGKGTFVNHVALKINASLVSGMDFGRLIRQSGYEATSRVLRYEEEIISNDLANLMQIGSGEKVIVVEKLYLANHHPAIISIDRIPKSYMGRIPKVEDWEKELFFDVLRQSGNIPIRERIEIEAVTKEKMIDDTAYYNQLENDAFLKISGLIYDYNNQPVDYGITYYDTKYIRYSLIRGLDVD